MDVRERLLRVMDAKDHPTRRRFVEGRLSRAQLLAHYQQEWATYVRDFPLLLARALAKAPPEDVRAALAANLYEEQTGGLSLGRPHADLFLDQMEALGFRRAQLEHADLLPEAAAYRAWLDHATRDADWLVATAVVTVFVEGDPRDRAELAGHPATGQDLDAAVRAHPLARHYGADPGRLVLVRAHRMVEGGHRRDAYAMVDRHATTPERADAVVEVVERSLAVWRVYRDAVGRRIDGLARAA